jgi:drug/metabolite transporter (DMT)-like permease
MSVPNGENWLWIAGVIVVGGFLGHSMMNWSLVRVPLWLGSALTLLIPVISSIAAWIFLDESLSSIQLAAMVVVVLALAYIVVSQHGSEQRQVVIRSTADPAGTLAP